MSRLVTARAEPLRATPRLMRLGLRRDRLVLPAWTVTTGGLAAAIATSVVGLYTTEQERIAAASFSAANPVVRAFDGPTAGADVGSLILMEGYWLLAVLISLAAAQTVVRHTRADEEAGRAELIGAAVVGRHARLAAALGVALVGVMATAAVVMVVLAAVGLAGSGVLLTGATLVGCGAVFAAIAALVAQLVTRSRTANAATAATIGAAFVLRAIGDAAGRVGADGVSVVSAWPSWLSPIGWGQQARPFADGRWWVLGLFVVAVIAVLTLAIAVAARRDLGGALLPARPGPARAGRWLTGPTGLAWRLQRPVLVGWLIGLALLGAAFGAVGDSADELLALSDDLAVALETLAADAGVLGTYIGFAIGFLSVAAAAFGVQAVLRVRTEERTGRMEPVLATAVARHRLLGAHVLVALGGTAGVLVALGLGGALGYGALSGDWVGSGGFVTASLVRLPAAAVVVGIAGLAVAVVPRAAPAIGWGVVVVSLVAGQFGALFGLPERVLDLSPFSHVPAIPGEPMTWAPILVLTAVASALVVAALVWFRRRDLVMAS
jgi:ABC-2 type transport system permease protein